ncbi:hypothetical protein DBR11_04125 [Pedobacter sp. HMWF019]|nr:hypothetical protein DBR11_04125 [Pedobacter sp. HMWF019]
MIEPRQNPKHLILAAICLLQICILDYLTPLETSGGFGILYIACIPIVMKESKKIIICVASLSTALIILNYLYFSSDLPVSQWMFPVNRIISVIGLWVATAIALDYKKVRNQLSNQTTSYTETLEEIIFITSHKVRNPVTNIVKIVELMDDEDLTEQNVKEMMFYLRKSVKDLESATREMTDHICDKEYNQNVLSV